jgi:UDP-glucose 4-epimerase
MILVVGGAGYIGSHICKNLHKQGLAHVVFDNLSQGHRDFVKWGDFFEGDLSKKSDINACFKRYNIDAVMHFSALANVGESVEKPLLYYHNNVSASINLLEAMQEFGVKQFIFSSTCAVYGEPQSEKLSEIHPQNPINPYGNSKKMLETIVKDVSQSSGLNYAFLRYFNAAGADPDGQIGEAHSPETHLIPLAIEAAQGKRTLNVFGNSYDTPDGTCIRDYIHVNDLATAHIKALQYLREKKENIAVNLGSGVGYSVMEIINTIAEITGNVVQYTITDRRPGDPAILMADTAAAKRVLDFETQYNLHDIIHSAWQWHNDK